MNESRLVVTSHVGRDLLQSAEVFRTEKHVVWEYVANGLQYVDPGTTAEVRVAITSGADRRIVITDNGTGMRLDDLSNYFVMHGENQQRKAGKVGRGRFGTGKSAAFGIAGCLAITTVRNGVRTKVRLKRTDIENMALGAPVPVKIIDNEVATDEPNGTTIEISDIRKKSIDAASIIGFIEGHIARWPHASVTVNHHKCEPPRPAVAIENSFVSAGTQWESRIGKVTLIVRVARAPLDPELQGIAVFSNGVWLESTMAGLERKDLADYIFGEVDVPRLDEDTSSPSPFDLSRSMKLNTENETVQALHAFIGSHVDEVLRKLASADREKRKSEEAKRLQDEADQIARIINDDFSEFRNKLQRAHAKGVGGADMHPGARVGAGTEDYLVPGGEVPATPVDGLDLGREEGNGGPGERERLGKSLEAAESPESLIAKRAKATPTNRTPKGGFSVQFENIGPLDKRAVYKDRERTIFVNLDHPQVEAARGGRRIDDPVFRRLAYEVAFTEYAVALASLMANEDQYIDTLEPIRDIRETIDRVTRAAAGLYKE